MSDIPSDLPGPVDLPTGPTEGAAIDAEQSASIVQATGGAPSIVGAPELHVQAPVAASGEVILAVVAPWYIKRFDPSVEGCPIVTSDGTGVPAQFADQAISVGAANGITIVKR